MADDIFADFDDYAHPFRAELPAYATALAIGADAAAGAPDIVAHLATCRNCAVELQELLELVRPVYAGTLTPAPGSPRSDLSFLDVPTQRREPTAPVWWFDAGRLAIRYSNALLVSMRQQPLAGAARAASGQLIYRYTQEPGSVHDLDVSIEVYAENVAQQQGRVRVGVDVASRSPLDQHGSLVTLYLGEANWEAATDETGCVDFAPVPLDDLPSLRVEITPLREIEK
ncbi:MAG: hypothetical protein ABIV47_05630 [Roseiflexaceae bacterium]